MVANFQDIENISLILPITSETRVIAHDFAGQQATKQKAAQILHNTLAILTVKNYLEMLGIAIDLANSDSWNPLMRACDNVADLNIANLGKIECRPCKESDTSCHIPMEVWDLRLAYVVVKLDDSLKQATLLGYVPQVTSEKLSIATLQPMEGLIDILHDAKVAPINTPIVNLEQWFNQIFASGWSTVENLLNPEQLTPAWEFRNGERNAEFSAENSSALESTNNTVQRAKLIDLGIQLGNRQVVLLVRITPEETGSVGVCLQVHPAPNNAYVPEKLILKVIESSGKVFMQAQARSQDNFIQLQFSGQPKESFSVQIVLDSAELTEQFQI